MGVKVILDLKAFEAAMKAARESGKGKSWHAEEEDAD